MPTTRRQAAEKEEVELVLTLDDVARVMTKTSGCLHSMANLINDTIDGRPGFFARFRTAGENSSANARAIWRFHDRRWSERKRKEGDDDEDDEEEEEEESIDDEIDRRIGRPFSFSRAVAVAIECVDTAKDAIERRKTEMEALADFDGALLLQAFVQAYEREKEGWEKIAEHLGRCSTYIGESVLDTSLRHGWL